MLLLSMSTLFPYTTLFRSDQLLHVLGREVIVDGQDKRRDADQRDRRKALHRVEGQLAGVERCIRGVGRNDRERGVPVRWRLDRKSTRLNSSHRCISYAVFC